jgi:hypothetical protein
VQKPLIHSCGEGKVLVDESTEYIPSLDLGEEIGLERRWAVRDRKLKPSVRTLGVVVLPVATKDPVEVSSSQNEHPVKQVLPDRSHRALGEGVCLG